MRIPGTVTHEAAVAGTPTLIGNPSGLLPVEADVQADGDGFEAVSAMTYRTQRRLMEGAVPYPAELQAWPGGRAHYAGQPRRS